MVAPMPRYLNGTGKWYHSVMVTIIAISALSGIVQLIGYIVYAKHVVFGSIRPNAASWSVWAFGAVIESVSYIYLTNDILKNVLPMACAVSAVLMFVMCLFRGHFSKISRFEASIVATDIAITIVWAFTGSPLIANILLVVTAVVSFIPIIMSVYKDPRYELAAPWFIWTTAYVLQSAVVIARFEKYEDLIYPLVFAALHIVVAFLALDFRKKTSYRGPASVHPEHL